MKQIPHISVNKREAGLRKKRDENTEQYSETERTRSTERRRNTPQKLTQNTAKFRAQDREGCALEEKSDDLSIDQVK